MRPGFLFLAAMMLGCGGGDDDGGGGGGADGGNGNGEASCSGEVTGASPGGFSDCVTAINEFPEGDSDIAEPYWIYSLVAAPEAGAELDPPLESLGINLFLAGAPETGAYALADARPETSAFVYAPYPTAYEEPTALALTVDSMEMVSEMDFGGYPLASYSLHGSFEMTLASETDATVIVTASF